MKLHQGLKGLSIGAAVLAQVAQPVWAATELRAVRLRPTSTGIELIFTTQGDSRPPILTTNRDNSIVVDLAETRLRLPETPDDPFGERNSFRKGNPAPGIASVTVSQLNARSVRVTVRGINNEPIEQVVRQSGTSLILSFNRTATTRPASRANASERADGDDDPEETSDGATPTGDNPAPPTPAQPPRTSQPPPAALPVPSQPPRTGQPSSVPPAPSQPPRTDPPGPTLPVPPQPPRTRRPTVPPAPQAPKAEQPSSFEPPLLSRAAAPPVGDIAVATIDITPRADEEEGRIILRTYRLNQLRATSSTTIVQRLTSRAETGGTVGGRATSGFDDSGSSSFESGGTTTAQTALGRTTSTSETIRYQGAKEILQAFGANGAETSTNTDGSFDDGTNTAETFDDGTNTDESFDDGANSAETFDDGTNTAETFDDSASDSGGQSASLLRGLEVVAEARTNTVTLIGSPRLVEIGTAILTQFDVRRRQVAVNVKIVDVDLTKGRNSNADLRFRVNNSLGVGFRPDPSDPASGRSGFLGIIGDVGTNADFGITSLARGLLATLFASIEDQSAKILTNPTLVVQEGSSAQVNLTQEIFSGVEITEVFDDSSGRARTRPIIRPAGVIVNVTVDHIDDNGFIDLSISPEVSAPSGQFRTDEVTGTLIAQRRLETGLVRLRDGQTLILTGIIQDQDRVSVSKVPILGDIPLLGRLFRREQKVNTRREVVVAVTPQILNDTDQPSLPGYEYRPGPDTQKLLKP